MYGEDFGIKYLKIVAFEEYTQDEICTGWHYMSSN